MQKPTITTGIDREAIMTYNRYLAVSSTLLNVISVLALLSLRLIQSDEIWREKNIRKL
jgi:hypothetical protein